MKCPVCMEQNLRSKVYEKGSSSTLLGASRFYDEDGTFHYHDPSRKRTLYKCSNEHLFTLEKYYECHVPECAFGQNKKETITIHEHTDNIPS